MKAVLCHSFGPPENLSAADIPSPPLEDGQVRIAVRACGVNFPDALMIQGETLLVLGAAGGLGLTAVELGKIIGARVIAAASSPAKLELARSYGADDTILYTGENLRDRLNALTDGRGVDVIFDPVGGDIFDQAVRRIAWEGRYLVIGFASGRIPSLPLNIALLKNASIVGLFWGAYLQNNPRVIRESFLELAALYAAGVLKPHIHQVFPLDEAASALRELMNRRAMGKILLKT